MRDGLIVAGIVALLLAAGFLAGREYEQLMSLVAEPPAEVRINKDCAWDTVRKPGRARRSGWGGRDCRIAVVFVERGQR